MSRIASEATGVVRGRLPNLRKREHTACTTWYIVTIWNMSILSIAHVNLRVPPERIRELKDFYCAVLGLSEGWRPPFASRGHWLYAQGEPIVHLVESSPGESRELRSGAIDHVALRCTDLEGTVARLQKYGVGFATSRVPEVGDVQLLFKDPVGTGVELTFGSD